MYKLFIADDEFDQVRGIKSLIDWNSNNIEICGEAYNGNSALEAIIKLRPDVVLLDIKMPMKSGLEILEDLEKSGLDTKFIILSGYDDFSYAQKAIRHKAVNYLLKPCKPDEIQTVVLDAINALESERSNQRIIKFYNANQPDNMDEIHNNVSLLVRKAIEFIRENYNKDLTLQIVSSEIYISAGYFSQIFKQETGINFIDYLNKYRIERAKGLIKELRLKNYEVAEKVGFRDEKYFSQMFKKYVGLTPSEYRNI